MDLLPNVIELILIEILIKCYRTYLNKASYQMLSSLSYSIFFPNVIELILFELVTAHLMIKTDFRTFWFSLGALLRKIGKTLLLFFESNYFWETNKQKLFPNNFFSKSPKLPRIITQKLKFYI